MLKEMMQGLSHGHNSTLHFSIKMTCSQPPHSVLPRKMKHLCNKTTTVHIPRTASQPPHCVLHLKCVNPIVLDVCIQIMLGWIKLARVHDLYQVDIMAASACYVHAQLFTVFQLLGLKGSIYKSVQLHVEYCTYVRTSVVGAPSQ